MDKVEFQITDGSVEYKHSKPRAEYETVAPLVRLNFTIAEGSDADAVVRKVMGMAVRHVEGVLMGEAKAEIDPLSSGPMTSSEVKAARRGRLPRNPTVAATDDAGGGANPQNTTSDAAAIGEPETVGFEPETTLTLKGDIQPLAQKVSAHLAKVDGNINKLRAVIKECGGNSLLNIPQANWPMFIVEAKKLLPS